MFTSLLSILEFYKAAGMINYSMETKRLYIFSTRQKVHHAPSWHQSVLLILDSSVSCRTNESWASGQKQKTTLAMQPLDFFIQFKSCINPLNCVELYSNGEHKNVSVVLNTPIFTHFTLGLGHSPTFKTHLILNLFLLCVSHFCRSTIWH